MPEERFKPIITSAKTAEHYTWGGACDGWHLVRNGSLSVIEESMPPGSQEFRHHHERAHQFFYVIDGEAEMEAEGETVRISARQGIQIPPGVRHQIRNQSNATVRFLVISQPPSHGDRVND